VTGDFEGRYHERLLIEEAEACISGNTFKAQALGMLLHATSIEQVFAAGPLLARLES
jgi:hypothetical protein